MTEYRVGVAVLRLAVPQLAGSRPTVLTLSRPGCWVAPTGLARLVLTSEGHTDEDAVEQAMAVFERAADRLTAPGTFVTDPGVLAVEAWKAGD